MVNTIFGPTFGDEIIAAGLAGLPFSWSSAGTIEGRGNLTVQQNANLDSVIAAHNPALLRKNIIIVSDFIQRWLPAEYLALMRGRAQAVTAGNVVLVQLWDVALALDAVDLNTPKAQAFKAAIVAAGILTQQRADAIFS